MGRMYSIISAAAAVTGAQDLLSVTAAANKALILHELNVTQESSETSDTGVIRVYRASAAGTTAASAPTPRPLDNGDAAMSGTIGHNLSSNSTETAALLRRSWNVLSGFHWLPTPESRLVVPGSGIIVVRSDIAITSATVTAELVVEEIG